MKERKTANWLDQLRCFFEFWTKFTTRKQRANLILQSHF